MDNIKLKQTKSFNFLIKDDNSVFYVAGKITRNSLNFFNPKDEVLIKLYSELENKNSLYINKNKVRLPFYTHFVEQEKT